MHDEYAFLLMKSAKLASESSSKLSAHFTWHSINIKQRINLIC
ncbi:hypothetical protein yrohd0001_27880 [Yersinia rohdei ATCC 43380]|nr:hypothetical protein yrohd0001_27880 [Yersinia rohdei ATCC 43380]